MDDVWRRTIIRLIAIPIIVVLAIGGFSIARFHAPGKTRNDTTVILESGTGLKQISESLEAGDVIIDSWVFRMGVRVTGNARNLQAGEFLIPARATSRQVMEILVSGKTVLRRITIPEGLTVSEIAKVMASTTGLAGEIGALPAEGSLVPETYYFSFGDERSALFARMMTSLDELMAELWPERDSNLPFDSQNAALILASIVEKETGLAEERPRIAAVFVNRLRRGMRLQSDPTVAYGITGGKRPMARPLTLSDLRDESKYNTYLIPALPPGAIANPGRGSISAVLHPLTTDELYFVANGDGGHVFAKTLAEHQRNVSRWRAIQRGRKN